MLVGTDKNVRSWKVKKWTWNDYKWWCDTLLESEGIDDVTLGPWL